MSARDVIAAAASIADLTNVTSMRRQVTKPGEGYVRLDHLDRSTNGIGFMATWQVIIALHQDVAWADRWIDDHVGEVIDALGAELVVTSATPITLTLDTGTVPALLVEGARPYDD